MVEQLLQGDIRRYASKLRSYTKQKDIRFVEWSIATLFDEAGNPESILSIANDVSDREKAMYDLHMTNRELDNFIYKASHDLQGPVARMQGVVNLGLLETNNEAVGGYFNMLRQISSEMSDLLVKLQTVHFIYEQRVVAEPCPMQQHVQNIIDQYQADGALHGLTVQVDIANDLAWHTDAGLLKLVIENLIDNAITYKQRQQPQLIFRTEVTDTGLLRLCAIDNGIGIPQQSAHRVFDMFYQGTPQSISNGLGMYLAKKAVDRLGGTIRLINPSKDTIFEVTLPVGQYKPTNWQQPVS